MPQRVCLHLSFFKYLIVHLPARHAFTLLKGLKPVGGLQLCKLKHLTEQRVYQAFGEPRNPPISYVLPYESKKINCTVSQKQELLPAAAFIFLLPALYILNSLR